MGKYFRVRRVFRRVRRDYRRLGLGVVVAVLFVTGLVIERNKIDADYTKLLNTIAHGESRGNYNAYYGNTANTDIEFTAMTVDEVLHWQQNFVEQGSPSNAVGKYQFIRPTLLGLVDELNINRQAKFDRTLQDRLAIHLLKRRGVEQYLRGRISREQFAHNLSKEWAALPRVIGGNPKASYYAGDGLNHVQISVAEVLAAIATLHPNKQS